MSTACSSRFLSVLALIVGAAALAAADDWDQDWMVATLARDGSWGVGIDHRIAGANAAAIRDCRAMSRERSDCVGESVLIANNLGLPEKAFANLTEPVVDYCCCVKASGGSADGRIQVYE
jgi:hypothetical protein